jgi:hypothetical protein
MVRIKTLKLDLHYRASRLLTMTAGGDLDPEAPELVREEPIFPGAPHEGSRSGGSR